MVITIPMKKTRTNHKRANGSAMVVYNLKMQASVLEQLRRQAKKEDRTAAYLVRVAVKMFLDDRSKVGGKS